MSITNNLNFSPDRVQLYGRCVSCVAHENYKFHLLVFYASGQQIREMQFRTWLGVSPLQNVSLYKSWNEV